MHKMQLVFTLISFFIPHLVFAAEWTEKIAMKGDFRYRHDYSKEEFSGKPEEFERNRHRMRLRLTVTGQVNESTEMITRLATGSTSAADTTTTNQTFDDYYSRKGIFIDQMYVHWKASDTLTVWMGKSPNPFYFVGGNDLLFDTDLAPEGASFKYKKAFDNIEVMANASAAWLDERYSSSTGDEPDVGFIGGQVTGNYKSDSCNVLFGYAHYSFPNTKNATLSDVTLAKGNSTTTTAGVTKYDQDYRVHVYSLEVDTTLGEMPIALFGEITSNETGYLYKAGSIGGIKFNKLKDPGSWILTIDRRELEKDATLAVLADGDSGGGGTNNRGWRVSTQYQVATNANIGASYFEFEKSISSPTQLRFKKILADLNFSF